MFQLDESFLESMGLGGMAQEQKPAFLAHLQEEIEVRVGEKMSAGMSDEQLAEFEKISDGDSEAVGRVLAESGDYRADPVYQKMVGEGGMADGAPETLVEYASMRWMVKNAPNYKEIVEGVMGEVRGEIEANREKILG